MKRNFYHNRRRLNLEQLESRQMLAGDVTVSVVGGIFYINGDGSDNSISISATANPDEFTVSSNDGGDTTINGGAGPVTLGGATGGIDISLYNGDDLLEFDTTNGQINIATLLDIDLGTGGVFGNDVEVTGNNDLSVGGDLVLRSSQDFDQIAFRNLHVSGRLDVQLGPIDGLGQVYFFSGSVAGDVAITTNGGYQVDFRMDVQGDVYLEANGVAESFSIGWNAGGISIGGTLTAYLSSAHLTVRDCEIGGDLVVDGAGWVTVEGSTIDQHVLMTLFEGQIGSTVTFIGGNWTAGFNHVGGNFVVTLDADEPSVLLHYLNVENDLVIRGGEGVENVQLNNVRAGNSLLIDTGAGNDIVWVHNSSADGEAAILAGAGSDYVLVGNFLGAYSLFLDTAAGFDLVNLSYASFGGNLYVWLGVDSDQATVYAASAQYMSVDAGAGYDSVAIQYSAADHLFAGLGEGNDSLSVIGSLARVSSFFDGGAGYDLLSSSGNLLAGLARQNFEAVGA